MVRPSERRRPASEEAQAVRGTPVGDARARTVVSVMLVGLLVAVLVSVVPESGSGAAATDAAVAAEPTNGQEVAVVLAVEGEGEQLPGPEPNLRNSFAPPEYEAPWTWWLSVVLAVVTVLAIAGFGLGYYLLFHRRRQRIPQR